MNLWPWLLIYYNVWVVFQMIFFRSLSSSVGLGESYYNNSGSEQLSTTAVYSSLWLIPIGEGQPREDHPPPCGNVTTPDVQTSQNIGHLTTFLPRKTSSLLPRNDAGCQLDGQQVAGGRGWHVRWHGQEGFRNRIAALHCIALWAYRRTILLLTHWQY